MYKSLGIESSCDETSAAIVTSEKTILANIVWSQIEEHKLYQGVVPEIAARSHLQRLTQVVCEALQTANCALRDISVIAATGGPGLIGGVIVGTMYAKTLASVLQKPYIAINHLEAHALTARLTEAHCPYPYLLLLVSGGHCQFIAVLGFRQYHILGQTLDDAVGETFDKTAKMLGLSYPGGAAIEQLAIQGNPASYALPMPLVGREGCDMSFSGLKTAVKTLIDTKQDLNKADLCAAFQFTIGEILANRTKNAFKLFANFSNERRLVIGGGVAANLYLRKRLTQVASEHDFVFLMPPVALCTDNAAMIAYAGLEALEHQQISSLKFRPRPRWNLEDTILE